MQHQLQPAGSDPARIVSDRADRGTREIAIAGRLTIANIAGLDNDLRTIAPGPDALVLDLGGVKRVDTAGAWIVHRLLRDWAAAGGPATLRSAPPGLGELIDRLSAADQPERMRREQADLLTRTLNNVGHYVVNAVATLGGFFAFLGVTLAVLARLVVHPRQWRFNAVVHQGEAVMVQALGIVGLMSFLVGLVIAQQGAVQLAQFGADVFTVNLIGRATMRELGVLMTAIMVAGRSGSAFAAQIGSMKLGEEIDAMRTIGLNPTEVLVAPRALALVLSMPLLTFFAVICALIGGGLFVYADLDMAPVQYVTRLQEVTPISDLWIALIKAPLFGGVIAITGCFHGMQVTGNAESVGERTTAAVVQSIFLVIVLDAFLAVFFTAVGWI
ncbi:MAG: MlaE family lipid ABC transporter permease subunit [Sphingomonadaceae bacterium]|nr:MlaE family lipid ABC transporter permease subunit [Sphingomonadaceae bacterium]